MTPNRAMASEASFAMLQRTLCRYRLLQHPCIRELGTSFAEITKQELWVVRPLSLGTVEQLFVNPRDRFWDELTIGYVT